MAAICWFFTDKPCRNAKLQEPRYVRGGDQLDSREFMIPDTQVERGERNVTVQELNYRVALVSAARELRTGQTLKT